MGDIQLKLSDTKTQEKLETIMMQLGFDITRRSVSEDKTMPPLLTYQLDGKGDADTLFDTIPRVGYGLTREPTLTTRGGKSSRVKFTVRQLVPTDTSQRGGIKTFGDDND